MRAIVPFDPSDPNTRLSSLLSLAERREFAAAMLADVLAAVRDAGGRPEILASAPLAEAPVELGDAGDGVPGTVDDRSLSAAVNDALADGLPAAVVMADLALANRTALAELFDTADEVVLAPGRGGGTNALVVRDAAFSVDYHGVSFCDHVAAAEAAALSVQSVDSFRLAIDVDDPADVLDVLVHGEGRAADWLCDAGFGVVVEDGEPTVVRDA
jgi:2-phospho-L-lactate guanylyltransferase